MSADVTIRVLGGARQVGKSAVLLKLRGRNFLLDYGVDISGEEPQFPLHVRPKDIDAVILSHAHLDHSGAVPLLYVSAEPKLYVSPLSLSLTDLLIADFLKISKYYIPYESTELERMRACSVLAEYGEWLDLGDVKIRFHNAGHIPGSAMIELEVGGARILYTGDFNLESSCLLAGASLEPFRRADLVIMEATYALFEHPQRSLCEKEFVTSLLEVLDHGGTVLVPAFAVGRAQEIMCVLAKYDIGYPVYLDGMARTVCDILSGFEEYVRSPSLFRRALEVTRFVKDWRMRKQAVSEPSVIISPAGMLKGGAALYYMEKIMDDPKNAVFFVSYQVSGSPGRKVLEEGVFTSPTKRGTVKARVEWFDFSSHCGKSHLEEAVKATPKECKVVIVHSEEEQGLAFAKYVAEKLGREVQFPKEGSSLSYKL